MLPNIFVWIVKLFVLLLSVHFSTNQKYGYYLTSSYNITSTQPVLSTSELIYNISQIARNFDIDIRGTILNLRNNNKTGDIFSIIYSKETSLNGVNNVLISLSYQLNYMTFYNTSIYLLYFAVFDIEISSISYQEIYTNTSIMKYMNILNQIKSNPEINSFGIQLFDPPVLTFNKLFVNLRNKPGNLRGTIFSTVYSLFDYPSSVQIQNIFPQHLTNYNVTVYQGFWNKFSIYSTTGTPLYEYYFIVSIKLNESVTSFIEKSENIDLIGKIFNYISNTLLTYGAGFNGEILNINIGSNTIDFHGSLFRGNSDLREINYIASTVLSTISGVTFTNTKIYNMYQATIYAYLDKNIYSIKDYLNNSTSFQENLKIKILNGLQQENLLIINGNYFDYIFQLQILENRIGLMTFFLIYTEKTNLFEVDNGIIKIFTSLPSIVDPFNSNVDRAKRLTTGIYPNYSLPYLPTPTTTIKTTNILTTTTKVQTVTTDRPTTTTTKQTTTTNIPTTTTTKQTTTTNIPTTTTTKQTTTTNLPTTTTTKQTTTTNLPTTTTTKQTTTSNIPTTTTTKQMTTTKTTQIPITTTIKPPQVGEITANITINCKFDEEYKPSYSNKESVDYKDFTNKMTDDIKKSFENNDKLRFISITYKSIKQGSVVVDFILETASTTITNASQIISNVFNITTTAFSQNVTVGTIQVESLVPVTTKAPLKEDPTIPITKAPDNKITTKQPENSSSLSIFCNYWNFWYYSSLFIFSWIYVAN